MKMDIPADKKYADSVFYVLNKIKKRLLFYPNHNQIVEYRLYFAPRPPEISLSEERHLLQRFQNEKIIVQVDEPDEVEIGKPGNNNYQAYFLYHFKVTEKFNDVYDRYQRIQNVTENFCWFDNNTFYLKLYDGSVKTVSFDTQKGTRGMLALFQTLIEHWKKNGTKPILHNEIVKTMAKFGSKTEASLLRSIISNVNNKKIKPAGLEEKISTEFDKKAKGWKIDIKR